MANITTEQVIQDGVRNYIVKLTGNLDTSDVSYAVIVDPALLSSTKSSAGFPPNRLILKRVIFEIEDALQCNLYWDVDGTQANATFINIYEGRGTADYCRFGGIPNPNTLSSVPDGKVGFATQGWTASAVLAYSMILEFNKVLK